MGEMLKADFDALRRLAQDLSSKADAIAYIPMPGLEQVVMPDTDLGEVATDVAQKFSAAFGRQADSLRAMSDAAGTSADDYEAVEQAFTDQLNKLRAEL
ncbi:hypothetical protein [Nocardia anaemiae]|uniref:hypothetical protein n=1 Tax=Nocardia anaemiae TaxID=263910 RepID=UPI0007C7AAE0|nr:hypothetical protein [Nocardia anaemiae]